jgi:hypothetical protein
MLFFDFVRSNIAILARWRSARWRAIGRGIHDGLNTGGFWLFRETGLRPCGNRAGCIAFHLIPVRQGLDPRHAFRDDPRLTYFQVGRESGFVRARLAAAPANSPEMESVRGSEPK